MGNACAATTHGDDGMNIPHKALILVADGQRCAFLRNEGTLFEPQLVLEDSRQQISRPTREQGTDEPGSTFASVGARRSSMEQTDFQRLGKEQFAAEAAALLNRRALEDDFEKLVVVAPPQTLAELRKKYDKAVTARLLAEVDKDLTNHRVDDIEVILARQ
jgi:protein required for attachment to host cells